MARVQEPSTRRSPQPAHDAVGGLRADVSHWVALAVIALLGLVAYANAFHAGFTHDDFPSIVENSAVHGLGRFFDSHHRANREVAYFSFALNHSLGGLNPVGYHALNILIHLVNAGLVYALAVLAFRAPRLRASKLASTARPIGFVAAALFVTHPIQTEAVTLVVQRIASLATTFYLAAVVLYARWRLGSQRPTTRIRGLVPYVGALVCTLLAMYTKQIAFTLPLAVCLVEWLFFEGDRRRVLPLLPLLATMAIIPSNVFGATRQAASSGAGLELPRVQTTMSRGQYLATQAHVVASYLRLVALPVGQTVDHDHPVYDSPLRLEVISGAAVLAALFLFAAWLLRAAQQGLDPSARLAAFGIFWFFLTLSVESTLIPIVDVMVEHRVYLPSAGLFVAIAVGAAAIVRRFARAKQDRPLAPLGALVALVLAIVTLQRNTVWASELTLWSDAAAKAPRKARPLNNLGAALADAGRIDEAIAVLEQAIRVDPQHPDSYHNLGRIRLTALHQYEEACALFSKAIALRPDFAEAYANLASALLKLQRFDEVVALLERAPVSVRERAEAQFNLAVAYLVLGNAAGAQEEYGRLMRSSPELAASLRQYAMTMGIAL